MRTPRFRTIPLLLLSLLASPAFAQTTPRVSVSVAPSISALPPANPQPFDVAITVAPPIGWHIYWKNPGDAGLPTTVKFDLPAGFSAQPLQYPIPQKFTQAGDITDYGYTGPTTFLARITPPQSLGSSSISIPVHISWLCCKERCVPGHATLPLLLPVSTSATPAATDIPTTTATTKDLFTAARAQMPASSPPEDLASQSVDFQAAPNNAGQTLTLHLNWKQPVHDVDLYPTTLDNLDLSDISAKTNGSDSTLSFTAHLMQGQKLSTQTFPVLIVYSDRNNQRHGFYTSLDLHALSAADNR